MYASTTNSENQFRYAAVRILRFFAAAQTAQARRRKIGFLASSLRVYAKSAGNAKVYRWREEALARRASRQPVDAVRRSCLVHAGFKDPLQYLFAQRHAKKAKVLKTSPSTWNAGSDFVGRQDSASAAGHLREDRLSIAKLPCRVHLFLQIEVP